MNETEDGGYIVTYMAMDDFSSYLYPPMVVPSAETDNELIETLVNFYNSIMEKYNPSIHAPKTTFTTHLPEPVNMILKSIILPKYSLVSDPKKVKNKFQPIFKMMEQ